MLYELLISHEDKDNNIQTSLFSLVDFKNLDVLELGAGTGRLTRMVAPFCNTIIALDSSEHMLEVNRYRLNGMGLKNWSVEVGEHTNISLPNNSVDVVLAGWTLSYSRYCQIWCLRNLHQAAS